MPFIEQRTVLTQVSGEITYTGAGIVSIALFAVWMQIHKSEDGGKKSW
jgi:hypothetical protein